MAETLLKQTFLPDIPLSAWEPAKDTLHLFLQIAGKIRLKLMPRKNHWWHATLYISARGISTGPMPYQNRTLELVFDFIEHVVEIRTCEGKVRHIPLQDITVADFYRQVFDSLHELDIDLRILARPYDNKSTLPFAEDKEHHHYNAEQVQKYWRVLTWVDQVLKEFSGRFYGKSSPVQFYWHHFDLTLTRYSGKKVPLNPKVSTVEKDAFSHEVITCGFWPGDDTIQEPAFFSYPFPLPAGIEKEPLQPASATWIDFNGSPMALLTYANIQKEPDPKQALLDFLESAYQAGAKLSGWPVEKLRVPPLKNL